METNTATNALANPMFSAFKASEQVSYVRPYDAKAIAIENYRHCVIRYREDKKIAVTKPAKMVTIPAVSLPAGYVIPDEKAQAVFIGVFEDAQDNIVRNLLEHGSNVVTWDSVSVEACLEALTAIRVSQRLTKEQVMNWVGVALAESIKLRAAQVSDAKGENEMQAVARIAIMTNSYKEKFGRLSAAVPNLQQDDAMKLANMLKVASLGDDMSKTLAAKLHAILNPEIADDL